MTESCVKFQSKSLIHLLHLTCLFAFILVWNLCASITFECLHVYMCVSVCALPIVVPVQLKYLTGSIWRLYSIVQIHADLKSDYSGIMLWNRHTSICTLKRNSLTFLGNGLTCFLACLHERIDTTLMSVCKI